MGYGTLTQEQLKELTSRTKNQVVHDLGSGCYVPLAHVMCAHGARKVIAVEKESISLSKPHGCIQPVFNTTFLEYDERYKGPIGIALVSWPANYPSEGLLYLIERAHIVIYLGKNTDGTMCGWPTLFWTLLSRRLLAYVPDRKNTLIVYGEELPVLRIPKGEELAGIQVMSHMYSYEQAERIASQLTDEDWP